MKVLRTASTRRLLASLVGLLLVVGSGTAIAVAAIGSGPVPPPEQLAQAIHNGLNAPAPAGITADITFTNHLIDASALQGSDPLLSGATGRLWLSGDHLRLELQSDRGDAQIVLNGSSFFVSDPSLKTVYEGTLPAQTGKSTGKPEEKLPTLARIQSFLNDLMHHANLSGAQPTDVAGHATYTIRVSPAHDGGLLGAAQLAWDAKTGVPLRFAVYSSTSSTPVLELKATGITYGAVPASVFAISPPSDSKVVKVSTADYTSGKSDHGKKRSHVVTGEAAVAARLPFKLNAPSQLVGLPRRSVTLLSWGKEPAAVVTYGQNLGGIAVIEQLPSAKGATTSTNPQARDGGSGLNLPTVSINGTTGQELDTALGTLVRFTRGGVAYTVVGSVQPYAANAAARGL